jgi:alpha-ribazole phosphatase
VRHGNTKLNSAGRYWGRTDVELSADGTRQAEQLRDRLAAQKIDIAYTSNLQRASATAKIIATNHQVDIVTCPELREINFGKIEGLTFKEVSQLYPEVAEAWSKWSLTLKYPDGESIVELNNRVSKFLERLEKHTPEKTILIVAHSAPLRLLICHLLGIRIQHWRQIRLDLASLSILDTYPQGAILNSLNDISHLG